MPAHLVESLIHAMCTLLRKEVLVEEEKCPWMRVPEAAEYFRIPKSRMYVLIQDGELPAVRIGQRSIRVNRREVEQFLKENCRLVS